MATPQVLSRKVNGVASAASSPAPADAPKPTKTKAPVEGEKVVIRRLAPGMTEEEFSNILGDAWKSGNGKVGWFSYHPGKISKDPAKPSRPSRAYLHVLRRDELLGLSDAVRTSVWEDARESWTDPALVGPPVVEQCIYKKIPSGKRRTDGRQGTIDQDREFMAFLESLANPDAHKDGEGEHSTDDGSKPEKATTTPLIEYLKEKKANKAKETAAAKSAKHSRQESQGGGKSKGSSASPEESKKKSKGDKSSDKPKETVKILTKKAATDAAADAAKSAAAQIQGGTQELPKSRRAGIAAAARILQRDLGLSPGNAHRKARQEAAKAEAEAKTATAAEKDTAASSSAQTPASPTVSTAARPATPTAPKAQQAQQAASSSSRSRGKKRGTGEDSAKGKGEKSSADGAGSTPAKTTPVLLLKKKDESQLTASQSARPSTPSASTSGPSSAATPAPTGPKSAASKSSQPAPSNSKKSTSGGGGGAAGPSAAPNPNATRAFVKHANPSQGVTEPLLKEAMIAFGEVTFVEIDRRKGFAYVDFAEPEGLARAIAANPVTVAQAAVQILERRDKEAAAGRRGGGGGGGGKAAAGGGGGNSKGDAGPSSAPATPTAPAGPAADKDKGTAPAAGAASEKRGGRRRGGRGRDRDRDGGAKDGAGGGGKNAGKSGGGGGGAAAAAAATT